MIEQRSDIKSVVRSNGIKLSIRSNRDRFFYPNEWGKFFDSLKYKSQQMTFDVLINTGARINEARHIKVGDIDFERNTIILRVTKVKARKGEKNPRPRTIAISPQFARRLKKRIEERGLNNNDYLGILSTPAANICMKKALSEIQVKDYYMFSIHNIRKTHGNWLKAIGVEGAEICLRLGHDYNTYLKAYGSPDIFSFKDLQDIRMILGDLYTNFRRGR